MLIFIFIHGRIRDKVDTLLRMDTLRKRRVSPGSRRSSETASASSSSDVSAASPPFRFSSDTATDIFIRPASLSPISVNVNIAAESNIPHRIYAADRISFFIIAALSRLPFRPHRLRRLPGIRLSISFQRLGLSANSLYVCSHIVIHPCTSIQAEWGYKTVKEK